MCISSSDFLFPQVLFPGLWGTVPMTPSTILSPLSSCPQPFQFSGDIQVFTRIYLYSIVPLERKNSTRWKILFGTLINSSSGLLLLLLLILLSLFAVVVVVVEVVRGVFRKEKLTEIVFYKNWTHTGEIICDRCFTEADVLVFYFRYTPKKSHL